MHRVLTELEELEAYHIRVQQSLREELEATREVGIARLIEYQKHFETTLRDAHLDFLERCRASALGTWLVCVGGRVVCGGCTSENAIAHGCASELREVYGCRAR